jgi:hypothetical protein
MSQILTKTIFAKCSFSAYSFSSRTDFFQLLIRTQEGGPKLGALMVLTNEKRDGLKVASFDRPRFC